MFSLAVEKHSMDVWKLTILQFLLTVPVNKC